MKLRLLIRVAARPARGAVQCSVRVPYMHRDARPIVRSAGSNNNNGWNRVARSMYGPNMDLCQRRCRLRRGKSNAGNDERGGCALCQFSLAAAIRHSDTATFICSATGRLRPIDMRSSLTALLRKVIQSSPSVYPIVHPFVSTLTCESSDL